MAYYDVLLPIAMILICSKVFSKACEKLGLPSVVGMLLTGVVIGLINYMPGQSILNGTAVEGLGFLAKIGVILIMFMTGIETDIKQIKVIGIPSLIITGAGVIVPMGLGFVVACLFNGGFVGMTRDMFLSNLFYGVILTATSVSVTVATLREIGKLNTRAGNTIVAAAVLDDIIGVVVLSFVVAMKGNAEATTSPLSVVLKIFAFFVLAIVIGVVCNKFFTWLDRRYPHHRLVPILSLALCFFFAYASEEFFGVADITGAFAAGLILSRNPESGYIERKSDVISYMIFTPVFFANIGITIKFAGINAQTILFGVCFIFAGIVGKVVGCGGSALLCKYDFRDSLRVGIGMMARAEVALVCAQKGVENGLIGSEIMPFILILIIVTSFITPIFLKTTYKNEGRETAPAPKA